VTTPTEIAIERRAGVIVAHLGGEIDMTNAGQVRDELLTSVPNDALALVIDLRGCRYLDSAGIEMVFDMARRLRRRRQDLRLALPASSPLKRLLDLTEVASAAPVYETLDAALDG
jgi:anti-anti-sigma factor